MRNIVITISRQYGSGGKTIGAMLAKELGINCYSREILRMASEDSGINEKLFGMSDEKVRKAGWFKLLSRPYEGGLIPPEDREFTSDDNLFNYQAKVIKELAAKESCVIVGYIEKTDQYRGDFYRYHTGHEWVDARNYDLCLNSGKLGFEKCVEEIKAYIKVRFGETL